MIRIKKVIITLISFGFFLNVNTSHADNSMDLGEYVVHYNAVLTTFLDRKVASTYNIKRSKNKAMINIAMIKKIKGTTGKAVSGMVEVYSTNLNNQLNKIKLRKITEDNSAAIYYIGEFTVKNEDNLTFNISVSPENKNPPAKIKFTQKFFTN